MSHAGPASPLDLSLVIACYNEEPILVESIQEVLKVLDDTPFSFEIIFVDDASRDGTRAVIESIIRQAPEHRWKKLFHPVNRGRGRTVMDGIALAEGRVVGFIDIDLEVHARYIPACVRAILDGYDVATAWRIYKLSRSTIFRSFFSRGYIFLVRALLPIRLRDTETGFKFFSRERILPLLAQTQAEGWFWDTEIMTLCVLNNFRIMEIPSLFIRRTDVESTVRIFRDSISYFKHLWRFHRALKAQSLAPAPVEREGQIDLTQPEP